MSFWYSRERACQKFAKILQKLIANFASFANRNPPRPFQVQAESNGNVDDSGEAVLAAAEDRARSEVAGWPETWERERGG